MEVNPQDPSIPVTNRMSICISTISEDREDEVVLYPSGRIVHLESSSVEPMPSEHSSDSSTNMVVETEVAVMIENSSNPFLTATTLDEVSPLKPSTIVSNVLGNLADHPTDELTRLVEPVGRVAPIYEAISPAPEIAESALDSNVPPFTGVLNGDQLDSGAELQIAQEIEVIAENEPHQINSIPAGQHDEINENEEIWAARGWWGPMSQHPSVTDEVFFAFCIPTDDPDELERRRKYREQINSMWSRPETPDNPHELVVTYEHPWWTCYNRSNKTKEHMSGIMWFMLNPEDLVEEFGEEAAAEINADIGVEIEIHPPVVEQDLAPASEPLQSNSTAPEPVAPSSKSDIPQTVTANVSVDFSKQPRTSRDCVEPVN